MEVLFATRGRLPRAVQSRFDTGGLGKRVDDILIGKNESVDSPFGRQIPRGVTGGNFGGQR